MLISDSGNTGGALELVDYCLSAYKTSDPMVKRYSKSKKRGKLFTTVLIGWKPAHDCTTISLKISWRDIENHYLAQVHGYPTRHSYICDGLELRLAAVLARGVAYVEGS